MSAAMLRRLGETVHLLIPRYSLFEQWSCLHIRIKWLSCIQKRQNNCFIVMYWKCSKHAWHWCYLQYAVQFDNWKHLTNHTLQGTSNISMCFSACSIEDLWTGPGMRLRHESTHAATYPRPCQPGNRQREHRPGRGQCRHWRWSCSVHWLLKHQSRHTGREQSTAQEQPGDPYRSSCVRVSKERQIIAVTCRVLHIYGVALNQF